MTEVKAGSEIGMRDRECRGETDGQADRQADSKSPSKYQKLLIESALGVFSCHSRILSEVVSVCQARSHGH